MNVDASSARAAGALGGAVMILMQAAASAIGRPQFSPAGYGQLFVGLRYTPVVGLVIRLGVSAAIAVLPALGFAIAPAFDMRGRWGSP